MGELNQGLIHITELDDRGKSAVRADLNLSFDPWSASLTRAQEGEVTLGLWKRELRKRQQYVPDYPEDKATYIRITHSANIKISMRALDLFNISTERWNYEERANDLHNEFDKFQLRNHMRGVACYRKILNDPKMAAFERCVPLEIYCEEIAKILPVLDPHISHAITQ